MVVKLSGDRCQALIGRMKRFGKTAAETTFSIQRLTGDFPRKVFSEFHLCHTPLKVLLQQAASCCWILQVQVNSNFKKKKNIDKSVLENLHALKFSFNEVNCKNNLNRFIFTTFSPTCI